MASVVDRVNYLNIALLSLSCLLAYLFPYYLLIFSYAVLGPAHYLTQISWLHDRKYFAAARFAPQVLIFITLALMVLPQAQGFLLLLAAFMALAVILPVSDRQRAVMIIAGVLAAIALSRFEPLALFITLLLPTVLHVFVFTACFMLVGALKEGGASGYLAIAALFACAASFFIAPSAWYGMEAMPPHAGLIFFQSVAEYLAKPFTHGGEAANLTSVFGFLSFAYTYHYLNWFSKTRFIAWHRIPRRRAWLIAAAYCCAVGFYAYDYVQGFALLLFLSLLHVLLEFPLNWRTFKTIGAQLSPFRS